VGVAVRAMQFSPASVKDVVRALVALAEGDATGLFNLGGPQAFSRLELLEMLVRHIRVHMPLVTDITPCSIHDFGFAERRPPRTSLDSRKAYTALDFSFQTMDSVCAEAARLFVHRHGKCARAPAGDAYS